MAYFSKQWTRQDIFNSEDVQEHIMFSLRKHYGLLWTATILMMIGACSHHLWNFGGWWTAFMLIFDVAFLCILSPEERIRRVLVLYAAALYGGASTAPLLGLILNTDTSFVVTTFVGITISPGWFLMAAIFTRSRSSMYYWGLVSSYFSVLIWLRAAPIIFGYTAFRSLALYMVFYEIFPLYIVVYSQQIIHEAGQRNFDQIRATLIFFPDFVAVLARLFRI